MSDASSISRNLAQVRDRIAAAAHRAGRDPAGVKLVAVTKYAPVDHARALCDAGYLDLGESRPQELWTKAAALADLPIRWHFIGHLQRNKVRRTASLVSLIHSLDSERLATELNAAAEELSRRLSVLIEVNTSGDAEKHGFAPHEVRDVLPRLAEFRGLEIRGLMTMASLHGGREAARGNFAALRTLRDELAADCPPGVRLDELSMGMSDDLEEAIEAGATIVRVGSALFEGVGR